MLGRKPRRDNRLTINLPDNIAEYVAVKAGSCPQAIWVMTVLEGMMNREIQQLNAQRQAVR